MNVNVDETGRQVEAGGIDYLMSGHGRQIIANRGNRTAGKGHVSAAADPLGRVYECRISHEEVVRHGTGPIGST